MSSSEHADDEPDDGVEQDEAEISRDVERLKEILQRHHKRGSDGPLRRVRSDAVVPDGTNRERTGLSLEHIHYLASLFASEGFRPRVADKGHDVPVYVHEAPPTTFGRAALGRYRTMATATPGYPMPRMTDDVPEFYCSLGNGHFTQALNLFRHGCKSIFTGERYSRGGDTQLNDALELGVPALVLSNSLSVADRKFVSLMLNRQHAQGWTISDSGDIVHVDAEYEPSQFEALSKDLDAEELSGLVRFKLGIDVSEAQGNYRSKL
eukprot:TRINITY_DN35965_c0_g1_i1.p1 TRINITY_DN35965_c0_g1~~TRINITY_DN35965_c0_g1_i1.p1  ORF type:complete len:265 (+),score=46.59 TRINITY_DN35965_c0_g1_i1:69-863(+)